MTNFRLHPSRLLLLLLAAGLAACTNSGAQEGTGEAPPKADGSEAPVTPAQDLTVRGLSGDYDLGDYVIMGEVVNQSGAPVFDVEVELELLDAAGQLLASESSAPVLSRIEAGGVAPLRDMHYSAPEGISQIRGRVTASKARSALDYQPIEITGVATRTGVTGEIVTGQARNAGAAALSSAKLVASFRDSQGRVTGVFFDYPVTGTWVPGRTIDFTIETLDSSLEGHTATVQGEGHAGPRR